MSGCKKGWNPDEQEQRYCYRCCQWFHVECIPIAEGKSQETLKADHNPGMSTLPRILRDMACQPAARGGARHFTAGNIRLVTKARILLKSKRAQAKFTGDEEWSNDQWKCALMKHFRIKKSDEGNVDREQLVVYDQIVYKCVLCSSLI